MKLFRRVGVALIAIGASGLVFLVVLHLPSVRARVLDRLRAYVTDQLDIVIDAGALNYNLLTRTVELRNVSLAAARGERPFLRADSATVVLDRSLFLGTIEIRQLELARPQLTLMRYAGGTTNLPRLTGPSSTRSPLRLGRIDIHQFTFALEDEAAGHYGTVGPIDLALDASRENLSPGAFGPSPFTIRFGATDNQPQEQTLAGTLFGRLGFDGTRVSAPRLDVDTPEGRLSLEGWTEVLGDAPRVAVRGRLDLNLVRAGRFAGPAGASLAGTVNGAFTVSGLLFEPTADLDLDGQHLEYRSLKGVSLSARASFATGRVELQKLDVTSALGEMQATGEIAVSDRPRAATGTRFVTRWRSLDLDRLFESAGFGLRAPVGASAAGQLNLNLDGASFLSPNWLAQLSAHGSARLSPQGVGLSPEGLFEFDLRTGRWSLKHSLASTTARVSLAGTASGNIRAGTSGVNDSTLGGTTRVRVEDLGAVTSVLRNAGLGLPSSFSERVTGALTGTVVFSGTLARPRLHAAITGTGMEVANLPAAELESTLTVDRVGLRAQSLEVRLSTASLKASGEYSWSGRIGASFEADARDVGELARALDLTDLPIAGSARLQGEAWGTTESLQAQGSLTAHEISIDDTAIGELSAHLALAGPRLRVEAQAPRLAVRAQADLDTREPFGFEARADFDRTVLPALVPAKARSQIALTEGTISGTVRARGLLRRPLETSAEADLRALDFQLAGTRVFLEDPATFSVTPDKLAASPLRLHIGRQTQVRLSGLLARDETNDALELHANGALVDVVDLAAMLLPTGPLSAEGSFDMGLRMGGTLGAPHPTGAMTVRGSDIRYGDLPPVTDLSLDARLEQTQIVLRSLDATWQTAKLSGEGTLPLRMIAPAPRPAAERGTVASWGADWLASLPEEPRNAALLARVTSITPDVLAPFVSPSRLQQIDGTVTASLRAEADAFALDRLRVSAVLDQTSLRLAGVPVSQVVPTRVQLENGYARIGDFRWEAEGNEILVTGGANVTGGTSRLDLGVTGSLDLRVLGAFASGIASAGIARTDLTVTGLLEAPVVTGSVGITAGELRVETPPLIASDLEGSVIIAEDRALRLAVTGVINGGSARITGTLDAKQLADLRGSVALSARNVVLEYPDGFQTESNADLTLTLDTTGAMLIGRVDILGGIYREPILVTRELLTGIQRQGIASAAGESSFVSALRLDLMIATADDVRIDNNYGRLRLSANLRVLGTPEQPGVVGRIESAPDGEIYLAGNAYRVETLVVDLTDPRAITPSVSFLAETRVGNVPIEVALDCRAAGPCEREVRSQAAGVTNEQAEALLFGVSTDPSVAGAQLAQLLSGEILGVVGRTVGLDTLRLEATASSGADLFDDPSLVAGDVDPASRLTLGKRLGKNVELVYSQDLADSGFTWSTTYFAPYGTSFRALLLDDQSRSYEFRHEPRFSASRRERPARLPGPPIAAVRIAGNPGYSERELRSHLELTEGDRFEFTRWQEDRERLTDLYQSHGFLEARIRARRIPADGSVPETAAGAAAGGIVLDYTIERGALTHLEVNGVKLPDEVGERIVQRWRSAIFDGFLERDARLIVREYLFKEGRLQAKIGATINRDDARSLKTLRIDVDPGPVMPRRLEFDGNAIISSARLYEVAEMVGSVTAWLDPASFGRVIESLYRQEGLLTAEVEIQEPKIQNGASVVRVVLREGEPWSVGRVTIGYGDSLPAEVVSETLGLSTGTRYQPGLIAESVERLERRFREAGFLDVRSAVETVLRHQERQVDVHVLVRPGPRSILSDVIVEGVDPKNPLIARAIELTPGAPIDPTALGETRRRLYDIGAYRSVDIELEPIDGTNPAAAAAAVEERAVVARVQVEERPRYRFRYGLAFNDEVVGPDERRQRPGVAADLENRNLFGRGATAGISVRLRRDQQVGRVLFGANRFLGLPLRSNLFLARGREQINGDTAFPIISDVTEITAEQTYRLRRFLELRYGYGLGRNRTLIEGQDFDLRVRLARVTTSGLIDRRSNPFDPAGGWFSSASFELSQPGLGSDLSFLKSFLQYFQFATIRGNVVLASAVRMGLARTFNNEDLIPSERFFAGGATSVRGYRENDLGQRSLLGAEGGRALLILNEEVRFPILRRVRGVAFLDLGNSYPTVGEIDISDLQLGIGGGVRIDTPFGLIRMDLGLPANRRPVDPEWRLHFGLGHAF